MRTSLLLALLILPLPAQTPPRFTETTATKTAWAGPLSCRFGKTTLGGEYAVSVRCTGPTSRYNGTLRPAAPGANPSAEYGHVMDESSAGPEYITWQARRKLATVIEIEVAVNGKPGPKVYTFLGGPVPAP